MNSAIGYSEGAEVPEDKTPSDNELIARFMDRWVDLPDGYQSHPYNESWDQLMIVVEKIRLLYREIFPKGGRFIEMILAGEDPIDEHYIDILSLSISTPIDEVYKAAVEFIKWYNLESLKNKPI